MRSVRPTALARAPGPTRCPRRGPQPALLAGLTAHAGNGQRSFTPNGPGACPQDRLFAQLPQAPRLCATNGRSDRQFTIVVRIKDAPNDAEYFQRLGSLVFALYEHRSPIEVFSASMSRAFAA